MAFENIIVEHLFVFIYRSEIPKEEMEKQLGVKITSILELADLKNAKLLKWIKKSKLLLNL